MDDKIKFLVYCLEIYKTANKTNGRQVMRLFNQYGIDEYIVNCYDALHTTGPEYIINDISELLEEKKRRIN
jgi:hypothetical protein